MNPQDNSVSATLARIQAQLASMSGPSQGGAANVINRAGDVAQQILATQTPPPRVQPAEVPMWLKALGAVAFGYALFKFGPDALAKVGIKVGGKKRSGRRRR